MSTLQSPLRHMTDLGVARGLVASSRVLNEMNGVVSPLVEARAARRLQGLEVGAQVLRQQLREHPTRRENAAGSALMLLGGSVFTAIGVSIPPVLPLGLLIAAAGTYGLVIDRGKSDPEVKVLRSAMEFNRQRRARERSVATDGIDALTAGLTVDDERIPSGFRRRLEDAEREFDRWLEEFHERFAAMTSDDPERTVAAAEAHVKSVDEATVRQSLAADGEQCRSL